MPGPAPEAGAAAFEQWIKDMKQWVASGPEQLQVSTQQASRSAAVRQAACTRLLASLKEKQRIEGKHSKLSVASLSEADQEALAVVLTADFLDYLITPAAITSPGYIAHMDQDSVQGELDHDAGKERFTLKIEYLDAPTSTTTGTSASTFISKED